MMKQIGIYVRTFPLISEAFITEQAHNLKQYQPTFIATTLLEETCFPRYLSVTMTSGKSSK